MHAVYSASRFNTTCTLHQFGNSVWLTECFFVAGSERLKTKRKALNLFVRFITFPFACTDPRVNTLQKEENAGDDVICLGEVLPSKELQEKAEKLQLPRHFYNYLESGGIATTDDDDAGAVTVLVFVGQLFILSFNWALARKIMLVSAAKRVSLFSWTSMSYKTTCL